MRRVILCLVAAAIVCGLVAICQFANSDPSSPVKPQCCPNGQCADGQCCQNGDCPADLFHHHNQNHQPRKKLDVNVNVDVTGPTATPATKKPADAELSDGEKGALVVCTILLAGGIAAVVMFKQRVAGGGKSKS
jgi:hypothetical protein